MTSIGKTAFTWCNLSKIECLAENPPTCANNSFSQTDTCMLYVPTASIDAYKAADVWKDFKNIEALSGGTQSGTCSENITWTLDAQGVLTLEGTGAMPDYNGSPWGKVSLTKVIIGEGITTIGNEAFYNCKGLTSVDIPNTVTSIGEDAFYNCISLTSVDIPNSVTSIRKSAFSDCEGLTSVTIPNSVTSIEDFVFYYCKKLASVDIPNSVTSIGQSAFYNCKGLTSITIPSSVTSIGKTAFTWCNLSKIECLAENPPTCANNSFSQTDTCMLYVPTASIDAYKAADVWKDFKNIEALSGGTQSGTCGENLTWTLDTQGVLTLEGTGAMADYLSFQDTPWGALSLSFTKAVFGEGITTIGNHAFANSGLTSVTIPSTVTSIGQSAFNNCSGLTSVTIPSSVTSIGSGAFIYCSELKKIECLAETPPTCGNGFFSRSYMNDCVLYVPTASIEAYKAANGWRDFTNIEALSGGTQSGTCGENVTWTLDAQGVLTLEGTGAMYNYWVNDPTPWSSLSFTKAVIGEGITTIGDFAFNNYTGLTSVDIPNTVTSIGENAFGNTALTSITIPSSVTSIGKTAFTWCNLSKIECLAENPPTCANNSFSQTDTCMLYVPTASIDAYKAADVWKDFKNIEALSGGTQSGTCGENITWTLDAQGVLTLEGTGAMPDFNGSLDNPWSSLSFTKVVIGEGITTIGAYAFAGFSGLTSVTIPSSVTTINKQAFYGCDGLKSVTIPNTVTSIGRAAFGFCTGLTSVVIPNSVTSIAWGAFGCCTGLTSVTIPSSVTTIEDQTFAQCTGLKEVKCLAVTPPTCGQDVFYNVSKDSCVLYVPESSIDAYKAADVWKDFHDVVSGINGVSQEGNVGVSASDGVITVTGTADNAVVEVYSISGMLVYRGTSNTVAVPSAGIYVVKAAGKTFKVNAAR